MYFIEMFLEQWIMIAFQLKLLEWIIQMCIRDRSREGQFFYHHKQNRFWKVLAAVFEDTLPETIEEKKEFLLRHNIAIWDVIASCDIEGRCV